MTFEENKMTLPCRKRVCSGVVINLYRVVGSLLRRCVRVGGRGGVGEGRGARSDKGKRECEQIKTREVTVVSLSGK